MEGDKFTVGLLEITERPNANGLSAWWCEVRSLFKDFKDRALVERLTSWQKHWSNSPSPADAEVAEIAAELHLRTLPRTLPESCPGPPTATVTRHSAVIANLILDGSARLASLQAAASGASADSNSARLRLEQIERLRTSFTEGASAASGVAGLSSFQQAQRQEAKAVSSILYPKKARPSADDFSAMWHSSPNAASSSTSPPPSALPAVAPLPSLTADDRLKAAIDLYQRGLQIANMLFPDQAKAEVPSAALDELKSLSPAPVFNAEAMLSLHRHAGCTLCTQHTCPITRVLHQAVSFKLSFEDKLALADDANEKRSYSATSHDEYMQRIFLTAQLIMTGVAIPLSAAGVSFPTLIVNPQFVVNKPSFAPTGPSSLDPLSLESRTRLAATIQDIILEASSGPASVSWDARVMKALERRSFCKKPRLVIDLSAFLNWRLKSWRFSYISLYSILAQCFPGYFIGMEDIKGGFNHVGLDPSCWRFCAMEEGGVTLLRLRLPFGLATAPAVFSMITAEVVSTVQSLIDQRLGKGSAFIKAYVDDFAIGGKTEELTRSAQQIFKEYCRSCDIALADKSKAPSTKQTCLGVEIDTVEQRLRLPADKAFNYLSSLMLAQALWKARKAIPTQVCNKLAGQLTACCPLFSSGKYNIIPVYRLAKVSRRRAARDAALPLSDSDREKEAECEACIDYWLTALTSSADHQRLATLGTPASVPHLAMTVSDASGEQGCGLHVGPVVLQGTFNKDAFSKCVAAREITPILLFLERFGHWFHGLSLTCAVDNLMVMFGINKGFSHSDDLRRLLRELARLSEAKGVDVLSLWFPRELNAFADALSKATSYDSFLAVCSEFLAGPVWRC